MTGPSILHAVAGAAATSVVPHDAVDAVDQLLADCTAALGARAAGILVVDDRGRLELLAATSHAASDLEAYQSQSSEGPCVEAIRTGEPVTEASPHAMTRRWPTTGRLVVANGFTGVHAAPLQWLGRTFGALTVFYDDEVGVGPEVESSVRALADAATLLIVTSGTMSESAFDETLTQALAGRAVIEQAKGALAEVRRVDMATAFDALRAAAEASGTPLRVAARDVLDAARRGRLR